MDSMQLKKAVIIGDSRVEGYCKTLSSVLDIVETCQFSELSHQEISSLAENYLNHHHPNVIILITLTNDLIGKSPINPERYQRRLFYKKLSFNPNLALENIKYYSEKWSALFPGLVVIWTIPDVPNLIAYNINGISSNLTITEKQTLISDEKDIYKNIDYLRENWKKVLKLFPNVVIFPLRSLIVNEIQEKASAILHVKYHDIRVYHNSKFYIDGINPVILPQPLIAELFASEIKSIIASKIIPTAIHATLPPCIETSSERRSPSPAKEDLNDLTKSILRRLRDRHEIEWYSYTTNPQSHPNYENEKSTFMEKKAKDMAFKGIYPSAEEISSEWSLYWKNKLAELYNEVWKKKKQDCLDLLQSSSICSDKSLEILPTSTTHSDRRRHSSHSTDSYGNHRNFQDYENNHKMYYYGSRGRGRNRSNRHYSDSRQFE